MLPLRGYAVGCLPGAGNVNPGPEGRGTKQPFLPALPPCFRLPAEKSRCQVRGGDPAGGGPRHLGNSLGGR